MTGDKWQALSDAMYADEEFIAWLTEYDPAYQCSYSGTLHGLHDAFTAGREPIAELEEEQETLMIMVETHKMVFEDQKKRIAQLEKEVHAMIYTVGRLQ
jgi:hypothetical protein